MPAYSVGTVKVLAADPNRWVLLGGTTTGGTILPGDLVRFAGELHFWFTVAKIVDALTFETIEDYLGGKPFDAFFAYQVTPLASGTTGQVLSADPAEPTGLKFIAAGGVGSGIPATIVDAKGDLIVATAADIVARLPAGTSGQVLSADPAQATGLAWIAAGGGGSGIPATIVDAKGDLIAATAADTVARLPVGTNGQILAASSAAATGLIWTAAPSGILATLLDAKGDLIIASANDTAARLAVGTDGQVPIADAAAATGIKWTAGHLARLTNATGATLVAGDVVTFATGTDTAVALVVNSGSFQKILVTLDASIANGAQGLFMLQGVVVAQVTGAINRGNYVSSSSTSKTMADHGVAVTALVAPPAGAAGIALTAHAGGFATIYLFSSTAGASGGGGSGTVTSVAIATGSQEFSVLGSPITTAGTITLQRLSMNAIGDITGAVTYDWNNGAAFSARLIGAVTLTLSNPINGGIYRAHIKQDGTGSRVLTLPGTVIYPGGTAPSPILNTAPNSLTLLHLFWDGTNYIGTVNKTGLI